MKCCGEVNFTTYSPYGHVKLIFRRKDFIFIYYENDFKIRIILE